MTEQKTWRVLIRINRLDDSFAYLVVPGWDSQRELRISIENLPNEIVSRALNKTPYRCHAQMNKNAYLGEEIYFSHWELD